MPFDDKQKAALAGPLNRAHVKPPAPGKHGDYIEGWRVIDEANRIFGFDAWDRETVRLEETNRELLTLTDRQGKEYQQWRVGFLAKVRISIGDNDVFREGTGFGSGAAKPESLSEAIESAAKEAETDAMKRALMTFGNPFGLALYDKKQTNVQTMPDELPASVQLALDGIDACDTQPLLKQWWKANEMAIPDAHRERIVAAVDARTAQIELMDRSAA